MNTEKKLLLRLRRLIGILIILWTPLSVIVGLWGAREANEFGIWYQSISAMYWSNARNVFLTVMSITGAFLLLYDGYDWRDKLVNSITALSIFALILFPSYSNFVQGTAPDSRYNIFPEFTGKSCQIVHAIAGLVLFVSYIVNILVLFTKHSGEITDKKRVRNIVYVVCGSIMAAVICVNTYIVARSILGIPSKVLPVYLTVWFEGIYLLSCGIAWLVKGEAIKYFNDSE